MRWRQVIALWVVAAALVAEYWYVERPRVPASEESPARERFLALDPADLQEVRLERGGRTIVSRRTAGRWTVVEPAGAPIPPDLVAAFMAALAAAEEIARVDAGTGDPNAFGLDERAARVEIRGGSGEPVVVTIGEPNPTGTAVYARRAGSPEVILIGRNVRYYEDLIFQALPPAEVPARPGSLPVGG